MPRNPRALLRYKLSQELHTLLDIPRTKRFTSTGNDYWEPELGVKIVNTILDTIKQALLRSESVHIVGLGVFQVIERPARKVPRRFVYGKINLCGDMTLPPKKIVVFTPAASIEAALNINESCELTKRQKRAVRRWK